MKGQTVTEYLITYGWAILIVIVVISALYSMGVFTIRRYETDTLKLFCENQSMDFTFGQLDNDKVYSCCENETINPNCEVQQIGNLTFISEYCYAIKNKKCYIEVV